MPLDVGGNATTNEIYIANYGSASVSVTNGATDTLVDTNGASSTPTSGFNVETKPIAAGGDLRRMVAA